MSGLLNHLYLHFAVIVAWGHAENLSLTISFPGWHVCCNLVYDPSDLFIILGLCGPVPFMILTIGNTLY